MRSGSGMRPQRFFFASSSSTGMIAAFSPSIWSTPCCLERGVVAAVVADLVEDRAFEQVRACHLQAAQLAGPGLPGLPVADLRVAGEQQHVALAGLAKLEREHEARVVGVALQRKRQFRRGAKPLAVDAPPIGAGEVIFPEEVIDFPPIICVVGVLSKSAGGPWRRAGWSPSDETAQRRPAFSGAACGYRARPRRQEAARPAPFIARP